MFNIGDKVVYPMHGAGVIQDIEEKNILRVNMLGSFVGKALLDSRIINISFSYSFIISLCIGFNIKND